MRRGGVILGIAGVVYPFAVFWGMGRVPASVLVLSALLLVGARIGVVRQGPLLLPLVGVAVTTLGVALVEAAWAAKAYPVLMSLGMATAFGLSLRTPPSLIEVFAGSRAPLEPNARGYMRKLTGVWCGFLLVNAALSLASLVWGTAWMWALYNGLISYLLMGGLFVGEWLLRRRLIAAAS